MTAQNNSLPPELVQTTITVTWNDEDRPRGVDAEEWAYTLRMGGLDVESVAVHDPLASDEQARAAETGDE